MTDLIVRFKRAVKSVLLRRAVDGSKQELKRAKRRAERRELRKRERLSKITPLILKNPEPELQPEPRVPVVDYLPTTISLPRDMPKKIALKEYRNLAKRYAQVITDATALHDHHSLTPGRPDWAEKWQSCKGKRILFFTVADYSGSFYKWAEAVNLHTPHAVRMISLFRHRFGYPLDILSLRGDLLVSRFPNMLHEILSLADEANVIHIKDQVGFMNGRNHLPPDLFTQFRKPMVYTLYGGTARKDETDVEFQAYAKSHAAVIAMTPDLCFDWLDAAFIPHCIDEDKHPFMWGDGKLMMHTPSTPSRKGTNYFKPAAERIATEINGRVEIITATRHDYIMRHKPQATIFFDQAGQESDENGGKFIGWYGNSALEAAVFGVPTMAHLSNEAIARALKCGYDVQNESAIINIEPSEECMYQELRNFFDRSHREREELAKGTRAWIEKYHSYRAAAKQLEKIYWSL